MTEHINPSDPSERTTEILDPVNPAEPPTEELPTIEGSATDPNDPNIHIDTTRDIFSQLEAVADKRGRPDMVGLEWRDERGLLHRVSSHSKIHRVVKAGPTKSFLPRLLWKSQQKGGPALERAGGPIIQTEKMQHEQERKRYKDKPETVDYRTVDVFNADDDLIEVLAFTGYKREAMYKINKWGESLGLEGYKEIDRFGEYFSVPGNNVPSSHGYYENEPRKITDVRWPPQPSSPSRQGRPNTWRARLVNSKVSFNELSKQQLALGFDDWGGLTWTDHNGDKKQIIRDMTIMKGGPLTKDEYPERVFLVRTGIKRDLRRAKLHYLYSSDALQRHFSDRIKLYGGTSQLNLHWERHSPIPADRSAQLGRVGVRGTVSAPTLPSGETVTDTHISLDEAYKRLSYPEVFSESDDDQAALQSTIYALRKQPNMRKYAYMLQETVAEIGDNKFTSIVNTLRDDYVIDMRRLGLDISPVEKHSTSWLIENLIKQRYYGKHPKKEAGQDGYAGPRGDPFEDSAKGRELRSLPIELRLGLEFRKAAIKVTEKQELGQDGRPRVTGYSYSEDPEYRYSRKIQALMFRERIEAIMKSQRSSDDDELTPGQIIEIGHWLQESLTRGHSGETRLPGLNS